MTRSIATVVRVRTILERRAAAALAAAAGEVTAADRRVAEREDAYRDRTVAVGRVTATGLQTGALQATAAFEQVLDARAVRDDAEASRRRCEAERTAASVRRRSAERLAERRLREAADAARVAAQRALDDAALRRRRPQP